MSVEDKKIKAPHNKKVIINDDVIALNTKRGIPILIDAQDYDWLSQYNWRMSTGKKVYARANVDGRDTVMHRLILGLTDKHLLGDHINGITTDNRRCNLRIATYFENHKNNRPRSNSITGYKGVSPSGDKFVARIRINKKRIFLGSFDTAEEAGEAYLMAAREAFGEFAYEP